LPGKFDILLRVWISHKFLSVLLVGGQAFEPDQGHRDIIWAALSLFRQKIAERIASAAKALEERARAAGKKLEGLLLARQIVGGVEMIAGVTTDPTFGPLVLAGMGGIEAEIAKDVALRLTPMTEADAFEMIASLHMAKRLDAFRGAPARDKLAFAKVLTSLSALVEIAPEIQELDLNPVMVLPEGQGAIAADVRIRIG